MNPIDKTVPSQTEFISFEFDLHHSPGEGVARAHGVAPARRRAQARAGAAFTFKTQPQPGWDGTVNCRFVEIEAQKKLSWAWVAGDIDTVVTFTLTPTASGTRLSLVQSGFKADQEAELRRRALRLEDDGREACRAAREDPMSRSRLN